MTRTFAWAAALLLTVMWIPAGAQEAADSAGDAQRETPPSETAPATDLEAVLRQPATL